MTDEPFEVGVIPEDYKGPSPKSKEFSAQLDDYVAPPFEDGADYEEVHIESVNPEFETVVMFDENDEVTVDPTLARIEAERMAREEKLRGRLLDGE
jgi:hypothetical protein